jgi:hypothetical protein
MIIIKTERKKRSDAVIKFIVSNNYVKIRSIANDESLTEQIIYNCTSQYKKQQKKIFYKRNRFLNDRYLDILEKKLLKYGFTA